MTDAIAVFEDGLLTPARWDKYLEGDVNALSDEEKTGTCAFTCAPAAPPATPERAWVAIRIRNWACIATGPTRRLTLGASRSPAEAPGPDVLQSSSRCAMLSETGPWFHDGHVQTIQEAVRLMGYYEAGHKLSDAEVNSIVSFLHSLTGEIPQQYIQPPSDKASPSAAAANQQGQGKRFATRCSRLLRRESSHALNYLDKRTSSLLYCWRCSSGGPTTILPR